MRPRVDQVSVRESLAQQYGFCTWTALKAEVDRQRAHADFVTDDVARAIAAR